MKYIIDEKNNIILKTKENIELKENERIVEGIDYDFPIFDAERNEIREANREEKIIVYKHDVLLEDGEIVENGKITKIKKTSDNAIWRKEYFGKGYWEKIPTREEICETGDLSVLQDGEKYEDGHIIQVPNQSTQYLKYSWDKETFTWELTMTKEELQQAKTNLILQHNKKRKEIDVLNEESEYFDVSKSVAKANDELEEIRAKINEIDKLIEEMNK